MGFTPDTQAVAIQQTKTDAYQADHYCGEIMLAASELPSPGDWGVETGGHRWPGSSPEASQTFLELLC